VLGSTGKYQEVREAPEITKKYWEVPGTTEKYREVHSRSISKFDEIY
jgi:hypothetical protein